MVNKDYENSAAYIKFIHKCEIGEQSDLVSFLMHSALKATN